MKTLIINSSNYVKNSKNQFQYTFPNNPTFQKGDSVAITNLSMYNSVFNVEAVRGNNTLSILFNFLVPITLDIVIPDGFYSISQINSYIQNICLINNYYMVNSSGQAIYFVEFIENPVYYSAQLNLYPILTSAEALTALYTQPVGSTWSYPTVDQTCQLILSNVNFNKLIGFNVASYPSTIQSTTQSFISSFTPEIQPVNSFIIRCNLINSAYSSPYDILGSQPINAPYGDIILSNGKTPIFNDICPNSYGSIIITFFDQNMNPVRLNDIELCLELSIDIKSERN